MILTKQFSNQPYPQSSRNHNTSGYTLIELLIYIALSSLLLITLTQLYSILVQNRLITLSQQQLIQDINYIQARFQYDVRRAVQININANAITLDLPTEQIIYQYQNNSLLFTDSQGTYRMHSLQTQVNSFSTQVDNLSANTQTLNLTIDFQNNTSSQTYTTAITTRL